MSLEKPHSLSLSSAASHLRLGVLVASGALALAFNLGGFAQQGAPQQQAAPTAQSPTPAQQTPAAPTQDSAPPAVAPQESAPAQAPSAAPAETQPAPASTHADAKSNAPQSAEPAGISEDDLKKMLVGKQLFLRGGYLDNSLSFNERGALIDHSAQGSYTLSAIEIDKVHLSRHKVELEGQRYGLHFLGAMPYEDPTKAVDRVMITPKKKVVKITIDRELVIKPKQEKTKGKSAGPAPKATPSAAPAMAAGSATANAPSQTAEASDATEAQAEIAAAPAAERPADPKSVTTTYSTAHANKVLTDALDNIFAQPFDDRMMAAMPDFWKHYYEAAAAKTDYRPADSAVLRQSAVDKKARLVSPFEPASNQFAQDNGVAGMSLYHVVIGADGKPGEISVARPIGFGLDESAVDSIRKAKFEPAIKDGKPVPVLLDVVVEFRIYSQRTAVAGQQQEASDSTAKTVLPGPYSVQHQ